MSDNDRAETDLTTQVESTEQQTEVGTTGNESPAVPSEEKSSKEIAGFQRALQSAREREKAKDEANAQLNARLRDLELAQMSKEERLQEELLEYKRKAQSYEEEKKALEEAQQFQSMRDTLMSSYEPEVQSAARELLAHNPYAIYGDEEVMKNTLDALKKSVKKASGEGLWVDADQGSPVTGLDFKNADVLNEQLAQMDPESRMKKLLEIDKMLKKQG